MSEIRTYATHFCGVGGACWGLEQAGLECVSAIDWLDYAVEYRRRNLGHQAICGDIVEHKPKESEAADLLWTSPPCFVAGTMILCVDGYKSIEEVRDGDLVLTHMGRWRRVTSTMVRNNAEVISLRAQGGPLITCTREHPFFARGSARRKGKRVFDNPSFIEAGSLERGMFLSQISPGVVEEGEEHSEAFWYMIGRYLAEGWASDKDKTVFICGSHAEGPDLIKIASSAGFKPGLSEERTSSRVRIHDAGLYDFVRQFGMYAHGKKIPGWVFSLGQTKARSLLDGYFSGDGCRYENAKCWTANSASKALALSIALMCQRGYGKIASCNFCKRPSTCVIEGRTVSQRSYWRVSVYDRNRSGFIDGAYGWKCLREIRPAGMATVYNLSVEEDESYVADGACVHNCQTFSTCAREWAHDNKEDRRNVLFLNSVHYVEKLRPRFVVLENVMGLGSHEADNNGHGTLDTMMQAIKLAGYHVEHNVLDAKDFGVPQTRPRIFIVGSRDGEEGLIPLEPKVEPRTFSSIMEHGVTDLAWGAKTYKTALMKVKRLAEKHGSFKISVIGGEDVLPTMTCGWGGGATRKKVAILDQTSDGVAFLRHPSVREGARAQGFPDEWEFPDSKPHAWTLIGNAVASPVARAIAEHLQAISRGKRPVAKRGVDDRLPRYAADAGDAPPVWLSGESE